MPVSSQAFGETEDQAITLFELVNSHGNRIQLTNYGAILVRVEVPDRNGKKDNINLGYPSLSGYLERHPYFGSTVGRFCNRIAAGKFELDGQTYTLAVNNGPNHLHGGIVGFDKLIWEAESLDEGSTCGVRFQVVSPDGQEGYPGTLSVTAEYVWNDDNELTYTFYATTDRPTVLNLTNHAYWNLAGAGQGSIRDHQLKLFCDDYLEVDDGLIPTGNILPVTGTNLDFLDFHAVGERLDQFPTTNGYDHCYVVRGAPGELRPAAIVQDPASGRVMEVATTQPGIQLYAGNHLEGEFPPHSGFCLETQHYPDSPNQASFPSTRLDPGQKFCEKTMHRFSVKA